MVTLDFFNEELTESSDGHISFLFEGEDNRTFGKDFLLDISNRSEERMIKSSINSDSLTRIEDKGLVQEINTFRGGSREEVLEVDSLLLLKAL